MKLRIKYREKRDDFIIQGKSFLFVWYNVGSNDSKYYEYTRPSSYKTIEEAKVEMMDMLLKQAIFDEKVAATKAKNKSFVVDSKDMRDIAPERFL